MESKYPPLARQQRRASTRAAYHIQLMESRRALYRSRILRCKRAVQAHYTELNLTNAYERRRAGTRDVAMVNDLCIWAVAGFVLLAVLALGNRMQVLA